MPNPKISNHFQSRNPSAIRLAQIEFTKRKDKNDVTAINTAIGNVSLPMHPAMQERLNLSINNSVFNNGIVKYTSTVGLNETNQAFLNIISASGFSIDGLYSQITDGSSAAMMLVLLGASGLIGEKEKPFLLIDPAYTNYKSMATRLRTPTVSITRKLQEDGRFELPSIKDIKQIIEEKSPSAILIIPYDNPTGQFIDQDLINNLARLCVDYNMWLVSDEAYREMYYGDKKMSSIWGITEKEVPGIRGRRICLDSSSKVWNACGLRIGALITDNKEFHEKSVNEFTANLCAPALAQYIFGSLAHIKKEDLKSWFEKQRDYYRSILKGLVDGFKKELPNVIISNPEASIYSVVDVRNIVKPGFDALSFVMYCAREGKIEIKGIPTTLLVSPMAGFYNTQEGREQGKTQMRIACVENSENMKKVPELFAKLLHRYESQRN